MTKPTCRERAVEALSLRCAAGAGSPGASVMLLADTLARRTPSDCSILCMMLLFGSNHFLSTARQPPSSGS